MQQPGRNADARASENAGDELVAAVLGAGKDNILKEVKDRGTWGSAAGAIAYGKSPPAPAEGVPAAEKVAGNAAAALALEEADRQIAELKDALAASRLETAEAKGRTTAAEFSANLRSQDAAAQAASSVEAAESSAAEADAREREHGAARAKTALAAAADAPDEVRPKGTPRRPPGRADGVDKRGAAYSPAEASPAPREPHDFAGDFPDAASDKEDADMDGSTTTAAAAAPNLRPREKKKHRAEDQDQPLPPLVFSEEVEAKFGEAGCVAAQALYQDFAATWPEHVAEIAAKIPTLSRNEGLHRAEAETVIGEVIFG